VQGAWSGSLARTRAPSNATFVAVAGVAAFAVKVASTGGSTANVTATGLALLAGYQYL
jgi:hypothetical protein